MNPVYRFLLRGGNKNLLNPYNVIRYSEGSYITDYIPVDAGKTYQFRDADGLVSMMSCQFYTQEKTFVNDIYSVNSVTIDTGIAYIRVLYDIHLNAFDLGIFQTPFTVFDSYYNIAHPLYKDDLALEYALETNEEYYRAKLTGKLTFAKDDYDIINSQVFDQQFGLNLLISYNRGNTWTEYWNGQFWKTDCEFNGDNKTVVVTPSVNDAYDSILSGLEKEFNLLELAPAIQPVKMDKRSMIQIYVPGQTVIGCYLSNMWWEQECEAITSESDLVSKYHFTKNIAREIVSITQTGAPQLPKSFSGNVPTRTGYYSYNFSQDGYTLEFTYENEGGSDELDWTIYKTIGYEPMWSYHIGGGQQAEPTVPYRIVLQPVEGSGATGTVELYFYDLSIFARRISDINEGTYAIPSDDLVTDNRNYKRVCGINVSDRLILSSNLTDKPTEWGIYQPGLYYVMPSYFVSGSPLCYPIARSMWSEISFWFATSSLEWITEPAWRKEFTLNDAYPIWSVISVLLAKVAPGIRHEGTTEYSQFLYGGQPLGIPNQRVLITPKSNIVTAGYDQPAQKAPITLKTVLNMLRDCFKCYWFLDKNAMGDYRLRIEHIEYFRNGGSYDRADVQVGVDLTQQIVTRNGKPWAYAQNAYQFDKPEMAAWYQFRWMDNSTLLFNGLPIEILSNYVNKENVETIEVAQFTSDIDYMLLNPGDISQDGFALLCPVLNNGEYKLPYFTFTINHVDYVLQNAYAAFAYLQNYYEYDMPAMTYIMNGVKRTATGTERGIKRLKTQSISFPALHDPDTHKLIKTILGNGQIQKISINLSSRNAKATLKYDTE